MQWKTYDYKISAHFLAVLINADSSGLSDDEEKQLSEWENIARQDMPEGYTFGHWSWDESEPEFARCEVCEMLADCVTVKLNCYRKG